MRVRGKSPRCLEDIGEWGLLTTVRRMFPSRGKAVVLGIGDDTAILRPARGKKILATSDILAEGIHFDLSYTSPYYLGRKAVAVNLSDIAAMGGIPKYVLLSLALPGKLTVKFIDLFLRGVRSMCRAWGVGLIGGDTSSSWDGIFISLSLLGEAEEFVPRSGARDGDGIFVTGTLGDSALGMTILRKSGTPSLGSLTIREKMLALRHIDPRPRLREGRALVSRRIPSAMIDVSDGLLSDLGHIVEESDVGARIWAEKVPFSEAVHSLAASYGYDPAALAMSGGEDYELLFTAAEGNIKGPFNHILGTRVAKIGVVDSHVRGVVVYRRGEPVKQTRLGYEHFRNLSRAPRLSPGEFSPQR